MLLKVGRNISGEMGAKDCCDRRLEAATISEILHFIWSGKFIFYRGKVWEKSGNFEN